MQDVTDVELLGRYANGKSEEAFAEIVRRRVNLVYSIALRQCGGDVQLAEDVTQRVFCDLARKADELSDRPVVSGWLYRSAQFAASDVVRAERRRRVREESHMKEITSGDVEPAVNWERLRPLLDEAMAELEEPDRDAVALRFLENRPFADIGSALRLSEDAARKRVDRALDKLHAALARRGVTSTSAALAVALANQVGTAAPAGLAASVTGAALAGLAGTTAVGTALFMGMTKLQIGVAAVVAISAGAGFAMQGQTNARLRQEIAALQPQREAVANLRSENQQLAAASADVETLRADDVELKQLEQSVGEIRKARAEQARVAKVRAQQDRRAQLQADLQERDRHAQEEVDRMNREGNALVVAYKGLVAKSKDANLTPEERAQADAAAKAKLAEIQKKQQEIKAYIEETRRELQERAGELRSLGDPISPPPSAANEQRKLEEVAARIRLGGNAGDAPASGLKYRREPAPREESVPGTITAAGSTPPPPAETTEAVTLTLPGVDYNTALSAYEKFAHTTLARDPSLQQVQGRLNLQLTVPSEPKAAGALRAALEQQLGIVIRSAADGTLEARLGP